jgi:protein involved in polysaccharide export with SLBB domain
MKSKLFPILIIFPIFAVTSASAQTSGDYVIKQNDELRTYVFANPELNINTTVPPDGILNFPLVGEICVIGITSDQLARILQEKISHFLIDPKISVFITAYNPLKVYILGAVNVPGSYDYKPGSRLTDYLADAGGFSDRADLKHCYIYALHELKPRADINLKKALEAQEAKKKNKKKKNVEADLSLDIVIEPFDTIYMKEESGFLFTEWRDVADAINIIVGLFTLYIVMSRS